MSQSTASRKQQINDLYALDIVKMTGIHIKCITLIMASEKIATIPCPNLRAHLLNCMALMGLVWIEEYKATGYEAGYF